LDTEQPTERGSGSQDGLNERHALPATPWTGRDMLWAALSGPAIMVGLVIVLQLWLMVFLRAIGLAAAPQVTTFITLLAEMGLLVPVWWFGIRKYGLPWSAIGLRRFDPSRSLGLGCMFLLSALAFNFSWSLLLSPFGLRSQPDMLPLFGGGFGGLLLALFSGGIVAPVAEELFFRGYLFAGLRQKMGRSRALWLSAALFALVHIVPTSWPPILFLGLLFAILYEQTGSIWPAVALHGAINSLAFVVLYLVQGLPS